MRSYIKLRNSNDKSATSFYTSISYQSSGDMIILRVVTLRKYLSLIALRRNIRVLNLDSIEDFRRPTCPSNKPPSSMPLRRSTTTTSIPDSSTRPLRVSLLPAFTHSLIYSWTYLFVYSLYLYIRLLTHLRTYLLYSCACSFTYSLTYSYRCPGSISYIR